MLRAEVRHFEGDDAVDEAEQGDLAARIDYMSETDMAVILSESQNEVQEFRRKGLDILPHRRRLKTEALDEKFKDPDDPLRLVFVCAMWMTGFDVPSCSTIYLDKPMRNHTLMQTIARANRVFADKNNGLIVDYIGVFRNLQQALAIYGTIDGGEADGQRPIKAKDALVDELRQAIAAAAEFCTSLDIDLAAIQTATGFQRIALMDDAMNAILENDEMRRIYLSLAGRVDRLFRAILPDSRAHEFNPIHAVFQVIAEKIRANDPEVDISEVMGQVETLLDRSIAAKGYVIHEPGAILNLGQIDFDALRESFRQGRKNIEANSLRGRLNSKIHQMVRLNPTRIDYLERLQQLIDDYNAGRTNVDVFFEKLLALAKSLSQEEQRGIAENLNEEELALFDLLMKPRPELTKSEIEQVKAAARQLLDTLKAEKLVLDWRKRQQTQAQVQLTIEDMLDQKLPEAYDTTLYEQKCRQVYDHVYKNYYDAGRSIYAVAG